MTENTSPPIVFSCKTCGKLNICALFRAIGPLLESWKENRPFEAENLARICREYLNSSVTSLLSSMEAISQ